MEGSARGSIHGHVHWDNGRHTDFIYARIVNGEERNADYIELDGERYERVRECEMKWTGRYCPPGCMVPQDMVQTCSACGGLGNDPSRPFHPEDPNEPIQFVNLPSYIRYCPLCGARIKEVDE